MGFTPEHNPKRYGLGNPRQGFQEFFRCCDFGKLLQAIWDFVGIGGEEVVEVVGEKGNGVCGIGNHFSDGNEGSDELDEAVPLLNDVGGIVGSVSAVTGGADGGG